MKDVSSLAERIIDHIADAVIYADRTGTIRRWNQGATALFGYSAAEALDQNLDQIIPEHLRTRHWRGFEAAMATGAMKLEGRPTLTRATHKSGAKLYVEMTFALVTSDVEGSALGSVAVARDATERVEAQRAVAKRRDTSK
jgi:PAS domain S-box-containing protein